VSAWRPRPIVLRTGPPPRRPWRRAAGPADHPCLEAERIARFAPERVEVILAAELLPEPRHVADHDGRPRAPTRRSAPPGWRSCARSTFCSTSTGWRRRSCPKTRPGCAGWQATSAGIGERLRRTGLVDAPIEFTTAAGVHGSALAEFVVLGLLYFSRDVPRLQRMQAARRWQRYANREFAGRRALAVGLGGVGQAIAPQLEALGLEVWGVRRNAGDPPGRGAFSQSTSSSGMIQGSASAAACHSRNGGQA
jgi:glyoxylate/hydroxypyruvate reductase A